MSKYGKDAENKGVFIMTAQEQFMEQFKRQVKACAEGIEEVAANGEVAEYFEDVLDVEIISDLQGDYRGARIALTLGGPNIYLDTREVCVKGYWGGDYAECYVCNDACNAVDDYFAELWEMTR